MAEPVLNRERAMLLPPGTVPDGPSMTVSLLKFGPRARSGIAVQSLLQQAQPVVLGVGALI
jgi:hypothetical protein